MKGRKPKPTALLKIYNTTHRPINENEMKLPPPGDILPPEWLSDRAKEFWNLMTEDMKSSGVLTKGDLAAWAHVCQLHANAIDTAEKYNAGIVNIGKKHTLSLYHETLQMFDKYASNFGLNPAARVRLKGIDAPKNLMTDKEKKLFG